MLQIGVGQNMEQVNDMYLFMYVWVVYDYIYIYIYISFDKAKNPSNQLISIVLNISHYGKMNVMDEMYPIMD
jgi:hypothetical protein